MPFFDYQFPEVYLSWTKEMILNEYENLKVHCMTKEAQCEYLKQILVEAELELKKLEGTIKELKTYIQSKLSQPRTSQPKIEQAKQNTILCWQQQGILIEYKQKNMDDLTEIPNEQDEWFNKGQIFKLSDENAQPSLSTTPVSTRTIRFTCCVCNQSIMDDSIILKCSHNYHQECMAIHMKSQLTKNPNCCQFKCVCNTKIPQQCYTSLNMPNIKLLVKQLHQNQIKAIVDRNPQYDFYKCQTAGCEYVYIRQLSLDIRKSWCSLCLEDIIQK